jgi:SAM-dependent methyltransferase
MSSTEDVGKYYAARAGEYEAYVSYARPIYAAVMAPIRARYQLALEGHDVLEIACGPGYWTEAVALTANSILATDLDPVLVATVRSKLSRLGNVRCQVADAYTLTDIAGRFTAAFAQFWWSHIPAAKVRSFLTTLHSRLEPGALVMFLDSLPYRHPRGRRLDGAGDLLEKRVLSSGATHEIIKNFPTESEILAALAGIADSVVYKQFRADGYWSVTYRTKS